MYKMLEQIQLKPKTEKAPLFLKVDKDVLEWYRKKGKGYQSTINNILRGYMDISERRLKLAQQLYETYYFQCFWHMKKDLIINEDMIPVIIKGLRKHGGHEGFIKAQELCP